jgi:ribosomal protein S18 acetylase RimI-like enzyme
MPEISIRPALLPDLPALAEMDQSYLTNYVWQMDRATEGGQITINFREVRLPRPVRVDYPYLFEEITKESAAGQEILVAISDKELVGYIGIQEVDHSRTAWVKHLVVKNATRRKGIASALVMAAQDYACQKSYWYVVIEMQSKNHPAIRLAQKLGYEFCGYNDHYYSNQDIALFFGLYLR